MRRLVGYKEGHFDHFKGLANQGIGRQKKEGNRLFISEVGEIVSAGKAKREQEKSWILERGTL